MKNMCAKCSYYNEDWSVGFSECQNEDLEEEDIDLYFSSSEGGRKMLWF